MALTELGIEGLKSGHLVGKINELLRLAAQDLVDRPGVSGARRVDISISIQQDSRADINEAIVPVITYTVRHALPASKGLAATAMVREGRVMIDDQSDDVRQPTLPNVTPMKQEGVE